MSACYAASSIIVKFAERPLSNIARLPLEVLEICLQYSPVSTQLAISRVSKLFHSLSMRPLYCHLSLSSPLAVVRCCRTLLARQTIAQVVRSFAICYTYYSTSLMMGYYRITKDALLALTGLHTLKLLVNDPHFITLLEHPTFLALRHFECYLKPSLDLAEFLDRHSKIVYLQLSPDEDTSVGTPEEADELPPLTLPSLQYFSGNAQSVEFLGASTLRAAILNWNVMDTDPDLPFSALQRTSHATLSLLGCRRRGWNLDLIDLISSRLPDVLSLHISNILLVDALPTVTYLQTIRSILPRFTQLQFLDISCVDYWEMGDIKCCLDDDFMTVTNWGDACASLLEIVLPHSDNLSWYRISRNVWIPDPKHEAGAAWLSNVVVLKRYHKWAAIADELGAGVSNITTAPLNFEGTIANVRSQLEDLVRKTNHRNDKKCKGSE